MPILRMKILVCVKRVPDTATKIKVGSDGKSIDTNDVEYVISPYDELAVEHAVQIKEKSGDTEVIVMSMGPADTEKILRRALAMGADRGIHISNEEGDKDPYVTAQALAKTIQEENPDLLLFGVKAVDDDYGQVGIITASILDMTVLAGAGELTVENNVAKTKIEVEGGFQSVEAPLPCAVTISKGSIEARICSLINIRKAQKKEMKNVTAEFAPATISINTMELPPARMGGKIVGEGPDAVAELFRLLKEEAKVL